MRNFGFWKIREKMKLAASLHREYQRIIKKKRRSVEEKKSKRQKAQNVNKQLPTKIADQSKA